MGHPVRMGLTHLETRTSNSPNPVSHLINQQITIFPTVLQAALLPPIPLNDKSLKKTEYNSIKGRTFYQAEMTREAEFLSLKE